MSAPESIDWSEPIEAIYEDGRIREVRLLQKNAGVLPGNDHWCCTEDRHRLDYSPGAINAFWASNDGTLPSYPLWRIRNVREQSA